MATNDIYQKVLKRVFKGNIGKQFQLLRQMKEIRDCQEEWLSIGYEPNQTQIYHITKVTLEYESYDSQIRNLLGETALNDMVDPIEEPPTE